MQEWSGRHKEAARLLDDASSDVAWAVGLINWILEPEQPNERTELLLALVEVLEADEGRRAASAEAVHEVLRAHSSARMLSEAGLSTEHGFFSEAASRLSRRVLPQAPVPGDLGTWLTVTARREAEEKALTSLPVPLLRRLLAAWRDPFQHQLPVIRHAMGELAVRLAAIGVSPPVARRLAPEQRACFVALARQATEFAEERSSWEWCVPSIAACREAIAAAGSKLESEGVSVALVFRLETMKRGLLRLERLAALVERPTLEEALELIGKVSEWADRERSIRALARRNLSLLARRITEHSGDTGEHYIAENRREHRAMLLAAAGGGTLTAATAAIKYLVMGFSLALFPEALLVGLNYAASFLLMQFLGFSLATKQPAMTAASLARSLREGGDARELVDLTARISRSQMTTAVGNLGAVIPAAVLLDVLARSATGGPVLSGENAAHVLHSLQPLGSGTIFFAALTGVLLWISSILAGAAHNWAIVRKLPAGIAASPAVNKWLGRRGAEALGRRVEHGIAGIAGYTSLGALLAVTPMAGKFLGLPLDVRHVTLSTGALTLAICALGPGALFSWQGLGALLGILTIALLNFGVSFVCALRVALRAQGVEGEARRELWRALLLRLRERPREFLLPPPADPPLTGRAAKEPEGDLEAAQQ